MAKNVNINDKVWKRLRKKVASVDRSYVKVGVLASRGGNEKRDTGITMVELAAIHEFGSPAAHIPERSFIRRTFDEKKDDLNALIVRLARAIVTDKKTVAQALGLLGAWGATEVKKTITADKPIPPPLQLATIARKKSDRPLVDTGRLVDAIQWEVVER